MQNLRRELRPGTEVPEIDYAIHEDLEGARIKAIGWEDAAAAKKEIQRAIRIFDDRFGLPGL